MTQTGTIKTWKTERGFGFIRPDDGSDDVFLHLKSIQQGHRKPRPGDRVRYQLQADADGRRRAEQAHVLSADSRKERTDTNRRIHNKPARKNWGARILYSLLALLIIAEVINRSQIIPAIGSFSQPELRTGDAQAQLAFEQRLSDFPLLFDGTVSQLLPDDNEGSRHQKFIVRLDSGQTLLISHNIDLAPRLNGLSVGDRVYGFGEYEWNSKGGVVHWTHHDPAGKHADGWLEWRGQRFQ